MKKIQTFTVVIATIILLCVSVSAIYGFDKLFICQNDMDSVDNGSHKTLTYVPADIYADDATAETYGFKKASNSLLSSWFAARVELDPETWEPLVPSGFNSVSEFVIRRAQGQYIEEITVLKVKNGGSAEDVKAMAEFRLNMQKENRDYTLYDDENHRNANMIGTGRVIEEGRFVIYSITEDTDLSILRAENYIHKHPNCSAVNLYKAIVIEEYEDFSEDDDSEESEEGPYESYEDTEESGVDLEESSEEEETTKEDDSEQTTYEFDELDPDKLNIVIDGGLERFEASVGKEVDVKIKLVNNYGLCFFKINILFDKSLSVIMENNKPKVVFDIYNNNYIPKEEMQKASTLDVENNALILAWMSLCENVEQDTVFATISFKVADDAEVGEFPPITVSINPNDVVSYDHHNDYDMVNVAYNLINGGINVVERTYSVRFYNYNGKLIRDTEYNYGDEIIIPNDPKRNADKKFKYNFIGWDKEITTCTGDAEYTAVYEPEYINYTVTFKDYDGTVLSSRAYHYGDKILIPPDPVRNSDETSNYKFIGWDKEITTCTGDAEYTAVYECEYINYTVIFKDYDGTVLSIKAYHYGDTVNHPDSPSREADETFIYKFIGWDKYITLCKGSTEYTAIYESEYINYMVIYKDYDGVVLSRRFYHYGDKIDTPEDPSREEDSEYTYEFTGWNKKISSTCTGNAEYIATYSERSKAIPGDVNNDGESDNKDVVTLFRFVSSNMGVYVTSYDFNGDGEVNNKDVVALFREVSKVK